MATHTTRICARSFLVARNVFHAQENVCSFRGWAHRRPSKVTFPSADPYLTEEKIVDITKEFQNKEYYKTLRRSNKSDGQENVKRNIKSKQPEIPLKDVQNSNLFDYENIDKQTHNPEKVNKKKISKSNLNQKFERSQKNGLKHEDNFNEENKLKERKKNSDNAAKMKEFLLKQQAPKVVQNLFDSDGRFNFEKLDYGDNKISNLIIKLKSRKSRGRCGQIMVEGWRLIADGLQAGCELDLLLFSRISDLERLRPYLPVLGPRVCKMPYKEIQMWSNLETSPGLIGVFKTPTSKNVSLLNDTLPINLICDNIREPGNLGSILRAALGVGCENIMLTKGCTDIWDSKVLRSAAGAHFRMPIHTELDWNQIEKQIALNTSVFIADNNTNETLMDKFTLTGSKDEQKPLYPLTIPFLPYYSVDFTKLPSITLVIGGEAAGISDDCYRFANERMGVRLNIPTVAGLDSLNSNTALAIIAFEIKRQLLTASAPSHAQNQMTLNV